MGRHSCGYHTSESADCSTSTCVGGLPKFGGLKYRKSRKKFLLTLTVNFTLFDEFHFGLVPTGLVIDGTLPNAGDSARDFVVKSFSITLSVDNFVEEI